MKILNYVSGKLIMVAIAFSFAASTPIQARGARSNSASSRSEDDARLALTRLTSRGTAAPRESSHGVCQKAELHACLMHGTRSHCFSEVRTRNNLTNRYSHVGPAVLLA